MKTIVYAVCGLLGLCSLVLLAIVFLFRPGWDGVVASLRLEDGSEYMVTQTCNWDLGQYYVSFYLKPPGGRWGRCLIDHEASPWKKSSIKHDMASDTISIEREGKLQFALDRKGRKLIFAGTPGYEMPAPDEIAEPPFPFPGP